MIFRHCNIGQCIRNGQCTIGHAESENNVLFAAFREGEKIGPEFLDLMRWSGKSFFFFCQINECVYCHAQPKMHLKYSEYVYSKQ